MVGSLKAGRGCGRATTTAALDSYGIHQPGAVSQSLLMPHRHMCNRGITGWSEAVQADVVEMHRAGGDWKPECDMYTVK